MNIGSKIIEIRKKRNMTQEDFAKIFHVQDKRFLIWKIKKVISG